MQTGKNDFESLGLVPWIVKQIKKIGLNQPTDIQKHCIPEILSGKDCIGVSKTGSGKTFAFALPILQKLSEEPMSYFALILTPTHELAYQIAEQFSIAGQPMSLRVCVIAGGTDQMIESQKLQNRPHIIVAMPGRLADHLTGCDTFSFENLNFLVIDEADRMLNGSFNESLEIIEKHLPKQRHTLFFSATLSSLIKEFSLFPISENCFEWSEQAEVATVQTLDQRYILCAEYDRDMVLIEALRKFREENESANVMIFTNTKKCCQLLSMTLNGVGFENVCLHGFMKQRERVIALNKFKSKYVRTIIATDVASRGLDIPNVQLIINHRLPKLPNEYIHRVGRTARAGRKGMAISIFRFPRDLEFLAAIENTINTKLTEHTIDQRMVERIFMQVNVTRREAEVKLDNKDFDERTHNYRRKKWIQNGLDPDEMENKWKSEQEEKLKRLKLEQRERAKKRNKDLESKMLSVDERFTMLNTEKLSKSKPKTANKKLPKDDKVKKVKSKIPKMESVKQKKTKGQINKKNF